MCIPDLLATEEPPLFDMMNSMQSLVAKHLHCNGAAKAMHSIMDLTTQFIPKQIPST